MSAQPEEYDGTRITIRFDGAKCIHSRYCVLGAPGVFRANVQGPWIDPDGAEVERIVEIAHRCPSGAITYVLHDDGPHESPPEVNTVRVLENGPLAFHGNLTIGDATQAIRATLCRCGASKSKPYCDGSHADADFRATGEPPSGDTTALAERGGPIQITPFPNGPLGVKGNVEIIAGTGHIVQRTRNTALCRCGASSNKPFCDGTHSKIGFTAD